MIKISSQIDIVASFFFAVSGSFANAAGRSLAFRGRETGTRLQGLVVSRALAARPQPCGGG